MKYAVRFSFSLLVLLLAASLASSQEDVEGSKDNPHLSRMPGFYISEANNKDFEVYRFFNGKELVAVEGKLYRNQYNPKEGAQKRSELQVRRNYLNAIKGLGGVILFDGQTEKYGTEDPRRNNAVLTGKVTKGSSELWVEVWPWDDGSEVLYLLTVVEKEAMKQDVTASDLLKALNADGHVAVYINFDTNNATIKPESKSIIDQIVQMLKQTPSLRISIEGHTDSTGDAKKNKVLSEERAKAVFSALGKEGIDGKRLSVVGWGQEKPIADNKTEDGKAKNRRVELVKK
ncbi:MAG: OmpA family protein [candidate division NC10 bacterium]|nr:OmpA family protein [candidate division NC10 bacterium]